MKILITGVSGYVGAYLLKKLENSGNEVFGIYNSNPVKSKNAELTKCSLTDFDSVSKIFRLIKPDVVYHLASVTPTRITNEPDGYIELFNHGATEHIAKLCSEHGSLLIYTSTDLVYAEGENLKEDESRLEPLTIYAKTKLMGEDAVKSFADKHIILRSSLVFGFTLNSYTSFFDIAYSELRHGNEINAFGDQFRNPLYVEDEAEMLVKIPGLYKTNNVINFCGDEYISRFEMCIMMANEFGFNKASIKRASCADFTAYPMVKRLGLNNEKMKQLGLQTNSFTDNLKRAKKLLTT